MEGLRAARLPFLAAGIVSLVYGLAIGLVRLGWSLPVPHADHLGIHGPLMVCGFLGTVIGLERAVAVSRPWAFLAPILTASGVVALLAAPESPAAPLLMSLASLGLALVYVVILRLQPSLFVATMALGAVSWLAGNLLWLAGWPIFRLVFWWVGFLVLTIAGERLELTRFLPPTRFGRLGFLLVAAALIGGTVLASADPARPPRLVGLALVALSVWLVRHDIARRTIRQGGLARFTAACLLSGYFWLGAGGALALVHRGELAGPAYDATLHAVFIGFVFAMIFGHAPIIFPAVLGGRAEFHRGFYAHLVLLQASIAIRVAGDLSSVWSDGSWGRGRALGGALSAVAVLLFLFNTVRSLRFGAERTASSSAGAVPSPLDFLPARWVPLLYLGFAHLSLAAAFATVAADPGGVAGFYYHPRLVAVVHMVALGWISGSILGSLYLIGPLAFRMALPAGRADHAAFASFAVGVTGMVAHFWNERLSGMVWAAGLVVAALAFVGGRVLRGLRKAPVPAEARLPVALAFVNVFAAAAVGILLGVNKTHPFLPASQLDVVIGHAHLATIGWASMMVMGAGYRLLPMVLPAAMPRGPWPWVGTLLTQLGAWGLALGFFAGGRWIAPFACVAGAGVAVFLGQVVWMARHLRPPPAERPQPDLSLGHAIQALAYLAAATLVGVGLAFSPPSEAALRWVMVYGTFALVGFLSNMIVGVAGRLLPLYGWLWGFADRGHKETPPSLHRAPSRPAQAITLLLWTAAVPSLAAGLALDRPWLISGAATALCAGVVLAAANLGLALHRLWRRLSVAPPGGHVVADRPDGQGLEMEVKRPGR